MNASAYKLYHESFMANNHGSNGIHTYFSVLFSILFSLLVILRPKAIALYGYVIEYLLIIIPIIFGHTIFASYVYYINIILLLVIAMLFQRLSQKIKIKEILYTPNVYKNQRIMTIILLRGTTYLLTIFCILAVDFRIFPRYLAKTEKYGFSLMDTGVGLFVLMSGLVHKDLQRNTINILRYNTRLILMLFVLGISRYFAVKQLNYQEHVTEYGVHWNFFYTLAVSKVISYFILYVVNNKLVLLTSILVGIIHECILVSGVEKWIFSDVPRVTFLNANREGIFSCLGYVSMYLFAVHLKSILLDNSVLRINVIKKLLLITISLWIITYFVNIYLPISRTLANLCYCSYTASLLASVLLIVYFFEVLFFNYCKEKLLIINAINNNGLLYFLFANILTGLINMTVRTLFVNTYLSILILNIYMIITTYFVVFLQRRGIKI